VNDSEALSDQLDDQSHLHTVAATVASASS
jgi:hypothetical protein